MSRFGSGGFAGARDAAAAAASVDEPTTTSATVDLLHERFESKDSITRAEAVVDRLTDEYPATMQMYVEEVSGSEQRGSG